MGPNGGWQWHALVELLRFALAPRLSIWDKWKHIRSVAERKRNHSVWYRSRTASDYDILSHLSVDAENSPGAPPMETHNSFLPKHKSATMRTGTVMGAAAV